jgi:hypothetical protein
MPTFFLIKSLNIVHALFQVVVATGLSVLLKFESKYKVSAVSHIPTGYVAFLCAWKKILCYFQFSATKTTSVQPHTAVGWGCRQHCRRIFRYHALCWQTVRQKTQIPSRPKPGTVSFCSRSLLGQSGCALDHNYSPAWKLWLKSAPGRALCAPGHLMGADPDETRLSEGETMIRPFAPSDSRVLSGSAPIK